MLSLETMPGLTFVKFDVCTAQAMGENVLGAVPELARTLARHEIKPEAEYNANAVYFDLFGLYMVRTSVFAAGCMCVITVVVGSVDDRR